MNQRDLYIIVFCFLFLCGIVCAQDQSSQGLFGSSFLAGTRISGFLVGSWSYNSNLQLVPEFAGGTPALADPGSTDFRFDKFGIGFARTFSSWLSASAALEVESHRDRQSHGFDPDFGCFDEGVCIERFGAEEPEIEVGLDKFAVNVTAPIGNGLTISLGRFDLPFGIERHDEVLLLTATTSEVFRFGRPNKMTGVQVNYTVNPTIDFSAWVVNRAESETTHDDFNDNNKAKSVGGRIGISPLHQDTLLNFGIGIFAGDEKEGDEDGRRSVVDLDFTYSPNSEFFAAGEFVWGKESHVSLRERGIPFPTPALEDADVNWWGFYLLAHQDWNDWFGLSARYGFFHDDDGSRTGVPQDLQSITLCPIFHLSRLISGLQPTGSTYARTRHAIDWTDLRLEYRFNHSNQTVFSDAEPATDILEADDSGHQFQAQMIVNF